MPLPDTVLSEADKLFDPEGYMRVIVGATATRVLQTYGWSVAGQFDDRPRGRCVTITELRNTLDHRLGTLKLAFVNNDHDRVAVGRRVRPGCDGTGFLVEPFKAVTLGDYLNPYYDPDAYQFFQQLLKTSVSSPTVA
jgi:hypothetical protein